MKNNSNSFLPLLIKKSDDGLFTSLRSTSHDPAPTQRTVADAAQNEVRLLCQNRGDSETEGVFEDVPEGEVESGTVRGVFGQACIGKVVGEVIAGVHVWAITYGGFNTGSVR